MLGTQTGDGTIRALMGKRHLRYFRSGQRVTDAGLALFQNFPAFRTWQGGEIGYGLMSADTKPNHLLIDGPFTDAGLAGLRGLEGLFALSFFWHCPAFTSEGLRPLQQLLNLGFLGCQSNHCDDDAMRHIADFPRLRMLMGQSTVASDAGFEALSHSQTIEYIWGRDCPNLTSRGFSALASMPALRGIAVSCKNVGDASTSQTGRVSGTSGVHADGRARRRVPPHWPLSKPRSTMVYVLPGHGRCCYRAHSRSVATQDVLRRKNQHHGSEP